MYFIMENWFLKNGWKKQILAHTEFRSWNETNEPIASEKFCESDNNPQVIKLKNKDQAICNYSGQKRCFKFEHQTCAKTKTLTQ